MIFREELQFIQSKLPSTLYLVGGAVRSALLGVSAADIDICAAVKAEDVASALNGVADVIAINPRIGTVKIRYGELSAEYTTFRRDSYPIGGEHMPTSVEFVSSPEQDALRRDFTVNAIYQRVDNGEIIDPTGGIADLKAKLLRTVRAPELVFAEDGLRLLRLVRFAAELGFEIEEHTFEVAKEKAYMLKDISVERIREELLKILVADTKYGVKDGHYRGLELLGELGLWDYFLPEMTEGIGITQNSVYHKYDVYGHILHTVKAADPKLRVAALFHDIAKPLCFHRDGNMHMHSVESEQMCKACMRRLKFSEKEITYTARLVRWHMFDFNGQAGENKKRQFVQDQWEYLEDIVSLKNADSVGTGCFVANTYGEYLLELKSKMAAEGVPHSIKELAVTGEDLIREEVPPEARADVLKSLLSSCALEGISNDRDSQLARMRGFVKEWKREH